MYVSAKRCMSQIRSAPLFTRTWVHNFHRGGKVEPNIIFGYELGGSVVYSHTSNVRTCSTPPLASLSDPISKSGAWALRRLHSPVFTLKPAVEANMLPAWLLQQRTLYACRLLNRTWRGHEGFNGEVCHESLSGNIP